MRSQDSLLTTVYLRDSKLRRSASAIIVVSGTLLQRCASSLVATPTAHYHAGSALALVGRRRTSKLREGARKASITHGKSNPALQDAQREFESTEPWQRRIRDNDSASVGSMIRAPSAAQVNFS